MGIIICVSACNCDIILMLVQCGPCYHIICVRNITIVEPCNNICWIFSRFTVIPSNVGVLSDCVTHDFGKMYVLIPFLTNLSRLTKFVNPSS